MSSEFVSNLRSIDITGFKGLCYRCDFKPDLFTEEAYQQLGIARPASLQKAVYKRQAEFLAGRYLAKEILSRMALPVDVGIGANRAPVWPEGVIGTISHHPNTAICAIQSTSHASDGIGIDIERVIQEDMVEAMLSTVVCHRERALISTLPGEQPLWLTLVFSAKESLFKALYGQVQRYFDFLDAEVITIGQQRMTIQLLTDLTPQLHAGRIFEVVFQVSGQEVLTFVQATCESKAAKDD